jgi:transcriptional regulator with XRE-family HTH domain
MSGCEESSYTELAEVLGSLALIVRESRRARGLSLRKAAKQIGVDFNMLSRLERGEAAIYHTNLVPIFHWLDQQQAVE